MIKNRGRSMGWLSVYAYAERKGGATRYRWRVHGADGRLLARSADSFGSAGAAHEAAYRVSALLASVFERRAKRAA